ATLGAGGSRTSGDVAIDHPRGDLVEADAAEGREEVVVEGPLLLAELARLVRPTPRGGGAGLEAHELGDELGERRDRRRRALDRRLDVGVALVGEDIGDELLPQLALE